MKSFLINLLIVLSLGLCGFNAYQWHREAKLHGKLEQLGADIFKRSGEIQSLQQTLQIHEDDIKRLEAIREALISTNKFLRSEITVREKENDVIRRDAAIQKARADQVEPLRAAYEKANENVRKANEMIAGQNQRMKQLGDERNELATRLNEFAGKYKSLGDDYEKVLGMYTNLVAQVEAANAKNKR